MANTNTYLVWDPNDKRWFITSRYMYYYLKRRWSRNPKYKFAIQTAPKTVKDKGAHNGPTGH